MGVTVSLKDIWARGQILVPVLVSLAIVVGLFAILVLQTRAGDNEVIFGRETKVFDQWIRQYMLKRRDAADRDGRFPYDRYYMDTIVARLSEVEGRLRGDEKRIFQARIQLVEFVREPVVRFERAHEPVHTGWNGDLAALSNADEVNLRRTELLRCREAVAGLIATEEKMDLVLLRELESRQVAEWKVRRELEFRGLPFLGDLRRNWKRLMTVKQQHLKVRLQLLELLDRHRALWGWDPERSEAIHLLDEALRGSYRELDESRMATESRMRELFLKLRFYQHKTLRVG